MKRVYETPQFIEERFEVNEYCASACGTTNTVYQFVCDAGNGRYGDVYTSDGKNLTSGSSRYFHACNEKHDASTESEFIKGNLVLNGGNDRTGTYVGFWPFGYYQGYETVPVIIWTDGGKDVHCTTNLKTETWEITKS